jgi:transketolase
METKLLSAEKEHEIAKRAAKIRLDTVKMIHNGKAGHTGGDLSAADLIVFLYSYMNISPELTKNPNRDYFILSKGHSAEILHCTLLDFGFFDESEIQDFGKLGSKIGGHPTNHTNGVESNTGSLGHGLGIGAGIALALQRSHKSNKVYVLTGDGELAEGSNWEAAMFAAQYKLENFTWIIDRNKLQISGSTEEVMALEPLNEKLSAFGFRVLEINGHNYQEIFSALEQDSKGQPKAIIANTIKGFGLPEAENKASWHHKVPSEKDIKEMEEHLRALLEEE